MNKQLKTGTAGNLKARVVEFLNYFIPCDVWCLTTDHVKHQAQPQDLVQTQQSQKQTPVM